MPCRHWRKFNAVGAKENIGPLNVHTKTICNHSWINKQRNPVRLFIINLHGDEQCSFRWKCSAVVEQSFVSRCQCFQWTDGWLGRRQMGLGHCCCETNSRNRWIDLFRRSNQIFSTRLRRIIGKLSTGKRKWHEKRSIHLSFVFSRRSSSFRWSDSSSDESSRRDSRTRSPWFVHSLWSSQPCLSRQRQDEQHVERLCFHHFQRQERRAESHRMCFRFRLRSFDSQSGMGQVTIHSFSFSTLSSLRRFSKPQNQWSNTELLFFFLDQ